LILDQIVPLLPLLPLSLVAGVDLYLTLLFLGLATRLGWESAPPGALGDLAVPAVLIAAGVLYLVERISERYAFASVLWNAVHTVIRPMAGALLALLALSDLPLSTRVGGAFAGASLALAAHVTRSGWELLLTLMPAPGRVRLIASVAEDAGSLAMLSLLLDAPAAAAGLAVLAIIAGLRWGQASSNAFVFALRLLWDSARAVLSHRRWRGPDRFPAWLRKAVEDPAGGGGLRGSPAGALNFPGLGLFRRGWVVVLGGTPLFLYRARKNARAVDLVTSRALKVTPTILHNRVDLGDIEGQTYTLYVSLDGPEPDDLRTQFLA
jgi:hypothetical protein